MWNPTAEEILVAICVGGGAVVAPLVYTWFKSKRTYAKAKAERLGHTEQEFVDYFSARQIPELVSRAVYEELSERLVVSDFPVLPGDDLDSLYPGWKEEVASIWVRCACRDATPKEFRDARIKTVEELVRYVDRFRPEEGASERVPGG